MFVQTTIREYVANKYNQKKGEGKMEEKIIETLAQVRPLLQRDGGDVNSA